jgi:hypothetical protein
MKLKGVMIMVGKLFVKSRTGATALLVALTVICFSKVGFAQLSPQEREVALALVAMEDACHRGQGGVAGDLEDGGMMGDFILEFVVLDNELDV